MFAGRYPSGPHARAAAPGSDDLDSRARPACLPAGRLARLHDAALHELRRACRGIHVLSLAVLQTAHDDPDAAPVPVERQACIRCAERCNRARCRTALAPAVLAASADT